MPDNEKKWYAVYTKPRWEKKVHGLLMERGMEAYCPLNRVKKKWSDRMKWVEEPLFKSYVFIRLAAGEMSDVRMVNGVVNFVYWLGAPAVVKNREIEDIRKFLDEYDDVRVEPLELKKDAKITIRKGALMDKEATVVQILNNKVQVVIESLGYVLVAVVDRTNVQLSRK
jgi:transcription antitermination factor NusG